MNNIKDLPDLSQGIGHNNIKALFAQWGQDFIDGFQSEEAFFELSALANHRYGYDLGLIHDTLYTGVGLEDLVAERKDNFAADFPLSEASTDSLVSLFMSHPTTYFSKNVFCGEIGPFVYDYMEHSHNIADILQVMDGFGKAKESTLVDVAVVLGVDICDVPGRLEKLEIISARKPVGNSVLPSERTEFFRVLRGSVAEALNKQTVSIEIPSLPRVFEIDKQGKAPGHHR